ncbi:MAG: HAD family phosphatase [Actinomycetes bacterium]
MAQIQSTPPTVALDTLVFDLGGVIINWDPRAVFRPYLPDEQTLDRFMIETDFEGWNARFDRGLPWDVATAEVARTHPEHAHAFGQYERCFTDSVTDVIPGSLALLHDLQDADTRLLALTNWNAHAFERTRLLHPWLSMFDGIVASGYEGVMKPDPAIFAILVDRYSINVQRTAFIDDRAENVAAAARLGFTGIAFQSTAQLRATLRSLGLPITTGGDNR